MRAVGDESMPPCQYEERSLLARTPAGFFDLQDSVGGKVVHVPLEASLERNYTGAAYQRVRAV